jgi:hypothetical protein
MPWGRLDQNIGKTPNDEGFDRIYKEGTRMTEKGKKLSPGRKADNPSTTNSNSLAWNTSKSCCWVLIE